MKKNIKLNLNLKTTLKQNNKTTYSENKLFEKLQSGNKIQTITLG